MGAVPDHIEIERFSPLGDMPVVVCDAAEAAPDSGNALLIGIDRAGACPTVDEARFDILLSARESAPGPWAHVPARAMDDKIDALTNAVRRAPFATAILRQTLRLAETLPFDQALIVESLAYSTLLGGAEFRAWRKAHPAQPAPAQAAVVDFAREGDHVTLTLNTPESRNATTARMRDALHEALSAVLDDPSARRVSVHAAGACFSTGGDLNEFGANPDLAGAHAIRTTRSVARLIQELGDRADVLFHGAAIGSGLEMFACTAERAAMEGAFFQMPELKMGLMPGAGGTVTLPRAIGRHRACFMIVGGARVSAATALQWGLVSEIVPRP